MLLQRLSFSLYTPSGSYSTFHPKIFSDHGIGFEGSKWVGEEIHGVASFLPKLQWRADGDRWWHVRHGSRRYPSYHMVEETNCCSTRYRIDNLGKLRQLVRHTGCKSRAWFGSMGRAIRTLENGWNHLGEGFVVA